MWYNTGNQEHQTGGRIVNTCSEAGSFLRVSTDSLRVNEIVDFDLYLPLVEGAPPVLYRERSLRFDDDTRERLAAQGVTELFVHQEQARAYRTYIEAHLKDIVADPDIPLETKSTLLYDSARDLVKDVLENPRAGDMLPRSGGVVEAMVTHLLRDPRAFGSLMRITSYDYYTYTHSVNVCVFSLALARRTGQFSENDLRRFGLGALLHDVGKSRVPADVLNVRGKLNSEQWEAMRAHPVHGYDILRDQGVSDSTVLSVTRNHHEKLGGNGYPDGLWGDDIAPLVRITTIADIFDALTTQRSYKPAMQSFPALTMMRGEMMKDLDPEYFRLFVEILGNPETIVQV